MAALQGKRVVITDKRAFMGPAIEARFTREGARVWADDRDLTRAGDDSDFFVGQAFPFAGG